MGSNLDVHISQMCRTCLQKSVNKSLFVPIDFVESDSEPTICHKLNCCVPELDLSIVPNALVCEDCFAAINSAYEFKSRCIRTEVQIRKCLQQGRTSAFVNLTQPNQDEHKGLIDIKAEPIPEDVSIVKEEHKCVKIEELETRQDYLSQLEIADMKSLLDNTDDSGVSYSVDSEQNNQDSSNASDCFQNSLTQVDGRHDNVHNLAKVDIVYQCYTCGYTSKSKTELTLHLSSHLSRKRCKGVISKSAYVQSREEMRSVDKPFNCAICDYRASRRKCLKQHMETHTGDKPFNCAICEYRARRKEHLKRHMMTHTGDKPFKCTMCEYRANQKEHLKNHLRIHQR